MHLESENDGQKKEKVAKMNMDLISKSCESQ